MTLEEWNTIFQFGSAILLGLTFAVGTGAVITGYFLGKRQEERIAIAGEGTAKALAEVAAANERTTKLELEASQQRERAAKAEHDLLELQQRLAWRRISSKEHGEFVAALKPFAGSIVEVTKLGDAEAGQFADDIISIFAEARWDIQRNFSGSASPPIYGLQCLINEGAPAAKALAAVLRKLPTVSIASSSNRVVVAQVFVGLKPPP